MNRIASFDVFDTCLTRRMADPSDVFYEVARRVIRSLGGKTERSLLEEIVAARICAEQLARTKAGSEETTLEEIWRAVADAMGWPSHESLMACELEVEDEVLSPVAAARTLVEAARSRGERIVFVSDMYLPADFIRRQLLKHGIAQENDAVYVSSEVGKTKVTGNLFRHVMLQERTSPENVQHVGDHKHSDYVVPGSLGIRAKRFPATDLTLAEGAVIRSGPDVRGSSRIAGAMRSFRLSEATGGMCDSTELTAQFLGPFVMAFATWILARAQAGGVKRLYFLSRDCQLVWKVARQLSPCFGGIDCRYLYMSRQAVSLPSALSVTPSGMPWMRRPFETGTVKSHLAKVDLSYEDVKPYLTVADRGLGENDVLRSDPDWSAFWSLLSREPLRAAIEQTIFGRRRSAHDYFRGAGLMDGGAVTIVDLGWYLSGQAALGDLLRNSGAEGTVQGLYLALKCARLARKRAGDAVALFYESRSRIAAELPGTQIFARQTLLEHILGCADHASVRCYESSADGSAGPVLFGEVTEAHSRMCAALHASVCRFVAANMELAEVFKSEEIVRAVLGTLAENFFRNPGASAVTLLANVQVSSDPNGQGARSLARGQGAFSLVLERLCRRWPLRRSVRSPRSIWPEADLAISSPLVQRCARAARGLGAAAHGSGLQR